MGKRAGFFVAIILSLVSLMKGYSNYLLLTKPKVGLYAKSIDEVIF
jgi:hypothetical protein